MQLKSQYLSDSQLNWLAGTTFPAVPANAYVALITTAPTDRNFTSIVEVSGGAYARQAYANTGWGAISTTGSGTTLGRQRSNSNAINFPQATANWGTVLGVALYDASSGGNPLWYGDLQTSQVVNNLDTFTIPANDLTVQDF